METNGYVQLASADLVVPTQDACLLWDFTTLQQIVDTFPGDTASQNRALVVANEIVDVCHNGMHVNLLSRCSGRVGRRKPFPWDGNTP